MIGSGVVDRLFPDLLIFTTDKHFIGHTYVNKIIYRPLKSIHFENSVVQFFENNVLQLMAAWISLERFRFH